MDIVIPFVDCSDKVWMMNAIKSGVFGNTFSFECFYNFDTIKYVLRGISKYIPYVENIFLVVSNKEQIPEYIDTSKVKIVLHEDFIPSQYLPCFNACTIEMFIHRIPGLGEEFLYFNDDMIPMNDIKYEDLFSEGLPCINFEEEHRTPGPSKSHCRISFYEALNSCNMNGYDIEYEGPIMVSIHAATPLLKFECEWAANLERHNSLVEFYTTPTKSYRNINQYYWTDILFFKNKYKPSNISLKYVNTADLIGIDDKCDSNYMCINDYGTGDLMRSEVKDIICKALNKIFPNKCKYER